MGRLVHRAIAVIGLVAALLLAGTGIAQAGASSGHNGCNVYGYTYSTEGPLDGYATRWGLAVTLGYTDFPASECGFQMIIDWDVKRPEGISKVTTFHNFRFTSAYRDFVSHYPYLSRPTRLTIKACDYVPTYSCGPYASGHAGG